MAATIVLKCVACSSSISEASDHCETCGRYVGPPNVRAAEGNDESAALERRYKAALQDAERRGIGKILATFEVAVKSSVAVVNFDLPALFHFVTTPNALYTSYDLAVTGEFRKPAQDQLDRRRRAVGGVLFGTYSPQIRYAALSLDGVGLTTYGQYSVVLRDVAISARATVLEKNSYEFTQSMNFADVTIPKGYRATWESRHNLAVTKTCSEINSSVTPADFPAILLKSDGEHREQDKFIEVHIFGPFDVQAIERVIGPARVPRGQRAEVRVVREKLQKLGKAWVEK